MKKQDFHFNLPQDLIAQYPLEQRTDPKLLVYSQNKDQIHHQTFKEIINFLHPGDVLVMNNTSVMRARLYGKKATGGKVEFLVERILDPNRFLAHIKSSKSLKSGTWIACDQNWQIEIINKHDDLFECRTLGNVYEMLEQIGHIPLPPYITRQDDATDSKRYQTIYAKHKGSVAAPTAGLHFDNEILDQIKKQGIAIAYVTLHVGAGTFRPVRCEDIADHKMHHERISIDQTTCAIINQAHKQKKRVIAVGTTSLRTLESAANKNGLIYPYEGETDIFITPGYTFKICDGLLTNFHLPESTLLMLVSAFIGHQQTMKIYQTAINHKYRFFSYGDACLFLK